MPVQQELHSKLFVLYVSLLTYHWNVTGNNFVSLHELFEKQYTKAFKYLDKTAENLRAEGEFVPYNWYNIETSLASETFGMISDLINKFERILLTIEEAKDFEDPEGPIRISTNALLDEIAQWADKQKWMLTALLK